MGKPPGLLFGTIRMRGLPVYELTSGAMVKPFEEVAFTLEPGSLSEPVRSSFGYHLIRVVERRAGKPRPFESVRPQVVAEYRRRQGERRVRRLLEERRAQASIAIAEGKL